MIVDTNNSEFQTAFSLVQNTNQSFFLTGKAGTGKSTFLKHIVEVLDKNFVIVAPTGIAAVNVGGTTIHSLFRFPLRPLVPDDSGIKTFKDDSEQRALITSMDTLIIDEISMVRADLIDAIDTSLRRNGGNPNLPFGGKQIVFVGDVFQLEPVALKKNGENRILDDFYNGFHFFHARVFANFKFPTIELQRVYRQTDQEFINLLNKVRINELTRNDLDKLNQRVIKYSLSSNQEFAIMLTTTNAIAVEINKAKLESLNAKSFTYIAKVTGEFEESKYPTDYDLELKIGAQVIFIKNDSEKRWVNGTIAQVCDLDDSYIRVKLKDGIIHELEQRSWENKKYHYDSDKKKIEQDVSGTFTQYPLKLAWAITIHKSQGLTFEKLVIDFGSGTFASGQAYVALSRATSLEGIFLTTPLRVDDVYVDISVKQFAQSFNEKQISIKSELINKVKNTIFHNKQKIGEIHFLKAIKCLKSGYFKLAFDNLIRGFQLVSCDCELSKLIVTKQTEILNSINSNPINCLISEFDFIRAVVYYFMDSGNFGRAQSGLYLKALNFVDLYLEQTPQSEIGYYLKGRILFDNKQNELGATSFKKSLSINPTARTHYRLGRMLENTNSFGLFHLYQSVLMNLSSTCAHLWLKKMARKRGVQLKTHSLTILPYSFNNYDDEKYIKLVKQLYEDEELKKANGKLVKSSWIISIFKKSLITDKVYFTNEIDLKKTTYNGYNYSKDFNAFEGDNLIEPLI